MTEKGKKLLEAAKNGGCAIVGMGVSNVPLAEYLLSLGGKITLRDAKEREKLFPGFMCAPAFSVITLYFSNPRYPMLFHSDIIF